MTSRYEPADLNTYGAEDDEDMDMILDAIDSALETDGGQSLGKAPKGN